MTTDLILREGLKAAPKVLPKPYPCIYDRQEEESDFAYGLLLGLKKIKKSWTDAHILNFIVYNAAWYVRAKRFKALRKAMIFYCECGREIPKRNIRGLGTIRPCHGSNQNLIMVPFIVVAGSNPDRRRWHSDVRIQQEDLPNVDY